MYCVKCGKFIEHNGKYCKDCEKAEENVTVIATDNKQPQKELNSVIAVKATADEARKEPNKKGFGIALTSIIMIPIAWIIGLSCVSTIEYNVNNLLSTGVQGEIIYDTIIQGINLIAAIVCCIIGLILTSKALNAQAEAEKNGDVKHTATNVLSIIAKVIAIVALVSIGSLLLSSGRVFF